MAVYGKVQEEMKQKCSKCLFLSQLIFRFGAHESDSRAFQDREKMATLDIQLIFTLEGFERRFGLLLTVII